MAKACDSAILRETMLLRMILAATLLATCVTGKSPNILLWMSDDLSYSNISLGGGSAPMPQLEAMVEQGVSFKKAWSNPICRPTRAMLMTGHYATETGWWDQSGKKPTNLALDFGTFGNLAKSQGYRTLIVGKWQLNGLEKGVPPSKVLEHGFDHYCLWAHSDIQSAKSLRQSFEESGGELLPPEAGNIDPRYWQPMIVKHLWPKKHKLLKTTTDDFGPHYFAQCINKFLSVNKTQPFFIYWAGVLPHKAYDPVVGDEAWAPMPKVDGIDIMKINGREADGTGSLRRNVRHMDRMIGYIRSRIAEHGHDENTIFVFTSDNGSSEYGKGSTSIDMGVHVPHIVSGGPIKRRGSVGRLFSLIDWYNTLADFMGAGVDPSRPNSQSWKPYLTKTSDADPRKWMVAMRGTVFKNGTVEPRLIAGTKKFILDGDNKFWDCRSGDLWSDCVEIDPAATKGHVYRKLKGKKREILNHGYSDPTVF